MREVIWVRITSDPQPLSGKIPLEVKLKMLLFLPEKTLWEVELMIRL